MNQTSPPRDGLAQLALAFRSRRTGLLVVGEEPDALRVWLAGGEIGALGPAPAEAKAATPMPKPNDSVRLRLDRVLAEIGLRHPVEPAATASADDAAPPTTSLRDRLIEKLADASQPVRFEEGNSSAGDLVAVAVATEPLILEAVRQMRQDEAVRAALGDLDQPLLVTTAFAEERTLTLTEGYLLTRIDGIASARQVLELVPLDPAEVERTLLGLLLTGRVESRPSPLAAASASEEPVVVDASEFEDAAEPQPVEAEPVPEPVEAREDIVVEAIPDDELLAMPEKGGSSAAPPTSAEPPPIDPQWSSAGAKSSRSSSRFP